MSLSKKPYKGCRDLFPVDKRKQDFLFDVMKKTAHEFSYEPYDGPMVEEVELYKAKSGEELINEQIYSFTDRGNREVAIRPEMTPTVARMVAQVHREVAKPIRWYSIPNLMRYEKPQRGRLREHWQFNVDIFGAPGILGELEILQVVTRLMENFGADESKFEILLNDRRFVDQVFGNLLSLKDEEAYKLYKIVDKAKKVPAEALDKMVAEVLSGDKADTFKKYLALKSFDDLQAFSKETNIETELADFNTLIEKINTLGLAKYIKYDPTIVRGLDYYTGVVFEVFDKHPDNRRAISGGGAYANLLKIFNEEPLAGVGFGLGDVTLTDFLEVHGLFPKEIENPQTDLLITYEDDECEDKSLALASELRAAGLKVEVFFGKAKFKKVMKYMEKRSYTNMAILGNFIQEGKVVRVKKDKDQQEFELNKTKEIIEFIKG